MNRRQLGAQAEDRAADYLLGLGYTIVTRRYKARRGELDLVALDGDTLVFVEVRQRLAGASPEESIGDAKLAALSRAAEEYVHATDQQNRALRFDVIAIDTSGLRHHIDVFQA
jgi:putative endonuclease